MPPPDPLRSLIRLRRLARDEAIRELAVALEAEAEAGAAVARLNQQMVEEEVAASRTDADDVAVEAFGRWLRQARGQLRDAELARTRADAETVQARARLVAARGSLEAAEAEDARRRRIAEAAKERRAQSALDEIGQQRRRRDDAP